MALTSVIAKSEQLNRRKKTSGKQCLRSICAKSFREVPALKGKALHSSMRCPVEALLSCLVVDFAVAALAVALL